jgi:c-di-GMP-binding flagellar brake protein YcgR
MSPLTSSRPTERADAYQPVTDAQTIRLMLIELMTGGHRLSLVPLGACTRNLAGLRLLTDERGIRLTHASGEWPALAELIDATITAEVRGARLRFEAASPTLEAHEGGTALRLAWPQRLLRLQERDAFRVQPADQPGPQCVLRTEPGRERAHAVLDLSALGLSLHWPASVPAPGVGELWLHCRLEIPGRAPLPCDLRVRAVNPLSGDDDAARKIGCEFDRPTPETQRAAQVYVLETERAALNARRQPARA